MNIITFITEHFVMILTMGALLVIAFVALAAGQADIDEMNRRDK